MLMQKMHESGKIRKLAATKIANLKTGETFFIH